MYTSILQIVITIFTGGINMYKYAVLEESSDVVGSVGSSESEGGK
jgi:hypothetical protein